MLSLSTVKILLVFPLCVLPHVCDDPAGADPIEDSSSVCRITDGVPTSKLGGPLVLVHFPHDQQNALFDLRNGHLSYLQ